MKSTSIPSIALTLPFLFLFLHLLLLSSVASSQYIRRRPVQPGEFDDYQPYTIVLSNYRTNAVYYNEPMHWQEVVYESVQEGGDPYSTVLTVTYLVPEEIKSNTEDTIRYLLTGGLRVRSGKDEDEDEDEDEDDDDARFRRPICALNFEDRNPTILLPEMPAAYRSDLVESIFCAFAISVT